VFYFTSNHVWSRSKKSFSC